MRDGAPTEVQAAAVGYQVRMDSFLGGATLAAEVPISSGVYSFDTTTEVIERVDFTVPALKDGRSWIPGQSTQAPLAEKGQEVALTAIMHLGKTMRWLTPMGRLVVTKWSDSGGDVSVSGRGVLHRAAEGRLITPTVPRRGGTLGSEFRRLMPAGIPVDIDPALVDRTCPSSFQWEEDRIGALYELADTWPALIAPDGLGGVRLTPDLAATPVPTMTFTDGEGGTVASAPRTYDREGAYNHVVARAQLDDRSAPLVQGEAFISDGPFSIFGPYRDVPRFYSSPTLKTKAQCEAAAASILARSMRPARTLEVVAAVDPRVEAYEPVMVRRDSVEYLGYVIAGRLPMVPGDMALTVSIVSEREVSS